MHRTKEAAWRYSRKPSVTKRNDCLRKELGYRKQTRYGIVNLKSVGMVESVRQLDGKTTIETRYFISSLEDNAKKFANCVRSHWGIENSLHWVLDVALKEDDCRIRKDNAPQNFAVMRQLAVNLLGKENRVKRGIKNKQFWQQWTISI